MNSYLPHPCRRTYGWQEECTSLSNEKEENTLSDDQRSIALNVLLTEKKTPEKLLQKLKAATLPSIFVSDVKKRAQKKNKRVRFASNVRDNSLPWY
jgi:hypothetical protein